MTIIELGAVGEFIGAIAVVVTLIYLAIQMRQNTNALKLNTARSVTEELQDSFHCSRLIRSWPKFSSRRQDN